MTYADQLRSVAQGFGKRTSDPADALKEVLTTFDMQPDVRSAIEKEFWQRESLYYVILEDISAYNRIKANVQYAIDHEGNITVELVGRKRHGKSTVARWLARLRWQMITGNTEDWEEKVIYEQAYSDATSRIKELSQRFWREVSELHKEHRDRVKAFLARIRGYLSMQDENWIEHHEDSQRAQNDLKNLVRTVASSGLDFFFTSTVSRIKEVDFRLHVVGINDEQGINLSFYYDNDGTCHGHLITPNVPETLKYRDAKDDGIIEILLAGGRKRAQRKEIDDSVDEVTIPSIPPDAAFIDALCETFHSLFSKRDKITVKRWLLYTIRGRSIKQIARDEGGKYDTVRKSILRADEDFYGDPSKNRSPIISNSAKAEAHEKAVAAYLQSKLGQTDTTIQPETIDTTKPISSTEFSVARRGGPGQPDVLVTAGEHMLALINCKAFFEDRGLSWEVTVSPEPSLAPGRAWLWLNEVTRGTRTRILPAHHEHISTGSVEERYSEQEFVALLREMALGTSNSDN